MSRISVSVASPGEDQTWSASLSEEGLDDVIAGSDAEAELVLLLSRGDAKAILAGKLDPSVAYMQGRLKSTGDNALLLNVLREGSCGELLAQIVKIVEQGLPLSS